MSEDWGSKRVRTDEQFHLSGLVTPQPCPLSSRYLREHTKIGQSHDLERKREGEVRTSHVSLVKRILRRLLEALIHLILY